MGGEGEGEGEEEEGVVEAIAALPRSQQFQQPPPDRTVGWWLLLLPSVVRLHKRPRFSLMKASCDGKSRPRRANIQ